MKVKNMMIIMALLTTTLLDAQVALGDKPYIEVNGKSEIAVMPDQIIVSIVLKEMEKGKHGTSTDEQLKVLKEALKKINIPITKLSLAHSNADYIRVKYRKKDLVNKANYNLILKNAKEVNEVFKMFDTIDVYEANIKEVTHSKIIEYKKQMRITATRSAKEKADYLLKELGAKRGLPLLVREEYSNSSYQSNSYNSNNVSPGSPQVSSSKISAKGGEIGFTKIKVTAQIYVKFLIEEEL